MTEHQWRLSTMIYLTIFRNKTWDPFRRERISRTCPLSRIWLCSKWRIHWDSRFSNKLKRTSTSLLEQRSWISETPSPQLDQPPLQTFASSSLTFTRSLFSRVFKPAFKASRSSPQDSLFPRTRSPRRSWTTCSRTRNTTRPLRRLTSLSPPSPLTTSTTTKQTPSCPLWSRKPHSFKRKTIVMSHMIPLLTWTRKLTSLRW